MAIVFQIWRLLVKSLTNNLYARIVAALLAGFVAFQSWLYFHHDPKIEKRVTQKIERNTNTIAKKAIAARKKVDDNDPIKTLRDRYCGDCK